MASTKLTYQRFKALFEGPRFAKLRERGAHVQRPLWASTSVKNPSYPDLMYVEPLVGRDTVNTVPPNTLEAILDHAVVQPDTVEQDIAGAKRVIEELAAAKISLYDITERLVADGVKSFADSFNAMLDAIRGKLEKLRDGTPPRVALELGRYQQSAEDALDELAGADFLRKLWAHDPSAWTSDPEHAAIIKNALGWLDIAEKTKGSGGELTEFAQTIAKRFDHVVVLGMGGSSLAPDILRETFGKRPGFPELHVLDSTDPQQIKALDDALDIAKSALHRGLEVGHDDRARRLLPLLLPARPADGRRAQRGRPLHRDHRSGHEARAGSEGHRLPAHLPQRPEHRRALLGALVLRHGARGAGRDTTSTRCSIARSTPCTPTPRASTRTTRPACASARRSGRWPRPGATS